MHHDDWPSDIAVWMNDVRIGVEPDATHLGGINLVGRRFGNDPEDLTLSIVYRGA